MTCFILHTKKWDTAPHVENVHEISSVPFKIISTIVPLCTFSWGCKFENGVPIVANLQCRLCERLDDVSTSLMQNSQQISKTNYIIKCHLNSFRSSLGIMKYPFVPIRAVNKGSDVTVLLISNIHVAKYFSLFENTPCVILCEIAPYFTCIFDG